MVRGVNHGQRRPSENVSGMNSGAGRSINVRPVDCHTVQGSTPGDHRAPSPDTAKASLQRPLTTVDRATAWVSLPKTEKPRRMLGSKAGPKWIMEIDSYPD